MNISLVKYTQEFKHNGLSTWIGAEMTLELGDDAMVAKKELKSFIHAAYYGDKAIPIEVPPPEPTELPSIQKDKIEINYDTVVEEINKCLTWDDLRGWQTISRGNERASEAFISKYTELEKYYTQP